MTSKVYENFFECLVDLGNTLGISNLKELDVAITFMDQNGFTVMADYLRQQSLKFAWYIRKEFEDANNA